MQEHKKKRTNNSKHKKKIEKLAVFIDFIFIKKWKNIFFQRYAVCPCISHWFKSVNIYFKQFRHSWRTTRWDVRIARYGDNKFCRSKSGKYLPWEASSTFCQGNPLQIELCHRHIVGGPYGVSIPKIPWSHCNRHIQFLNRLFVLQTSYYKLD